MSIPRIRGFFHPKARTHQSSFEKGHFVCPSARYARNVYGSIADVRAAVTLSENSKLLAKNLAKAKIPCG